MAKRKRINFLYQIKFAELLFKDEEKFEDSNNELPTFNIQIISFIFVFLIYQILKILLENFKDLKKRKDEQMGVLQY